MKRATVWTQEGCPRCEEEKTLLRAEGYEVEELDIGDTCIIEREMFEQLHLQNEMLPVVRIDGRFRTPASVSKSLEW